MKNLEQNHTPWLSPAAFWVINKLAWWRKALISRILWTWEVEVSGPKVLAGFSWVRLFDTLELKPWQKVVVYDPEKGDITLNTAWIHHIHPDAIIQEYTKHIINDGEKGWLYDENWDFTEIQWPTVIYEHPEGELIIFSRIQLSEREAIVKINQNWSEEIIQWSENPEIFINPKTEKVKNFRWTGSWEDGQENEKVPGAINFTILRLDNSQTYFSFPVRTKDNVVLDINLMIFYSISDVEKLVKNTHDPMCEFYNKIQAFIWDQFSQKNFDEIKNQTSTMISNMWGNTELSFSDI